MRGLKKIVDDTGWKFYMPELYGDDIDRYNLGTWDLADWTFGTAYAMFPIYISKGDDYQFSILEKIFWRLENIFRLLEWYIFLIELEYKVKERKLLEYLIKIIRKPISLARHLIFKISWKLTVEVY